jgi:hypothetical protein
MPNARGGEVIPTDHFSEIAVLSLYHAMRMKPVFTAAGTAMAASVKDDCQDVDSGQEQAR